LKFLHVAEEQEKDFLMLPNNFDFAMLPSGSSQHTLKELGMAASSIETIDYAIVSWLRKDLNLQARTNEGYIDVPVLWQTPERAYQVKNDRTLRDDAGALKLPLMSIERTAITKDPAKKGSFQAHYYDSKMKNGRSGRWVIAKRIVEDKTNNFAIASATRGEQESGATKQRYYPRVNKKIVIQSLSVPIPVYINVSYKIAIKTEYQEQMNSLVQPFIARTGQINAFTMKRNGHLYEAFIDQGFAHTNNVNNLSEDTRMFSTEVTINVLGYLIGEGENDDRPIVRVEENTVELTFPQERIAAPGSPNIFGDTI